MDSRGRTAASASFCLAGALRPARARPFLATRLGNPEHGRHVRPCCRRVSDLLHAFLVDRPLLAAASPAWVNLDGQPVLEIRVATGAQSPADLAERISRELRRLAQDPRVAPDQLVVEEEPPYWMVVQRQRDGSILPRLAVDERSARSFGLSQQALAEQYRDQLRAAIRQYRSSHRPMVWLCGSLLALLLEAAQSAAGISRTPEPYVLQTALNDFHVGYELNAYVEEVNRYRETRSALLAAIQDRFAAAGVEILSPAYHAIRDGNPSTVPPRPPS